MTRKAVKLATFIRMVSSIILALALVAFGTPVIGTAADDPCVSQQAALDQVQQQIDAHNARPHVFFVPEQAAEAAAYDAEAAQLNSAQAQAEGSLQDCVDTLGALAQSGPNSPPLKTQAPDNIRNAINDAKARIPPNSEQYTGPDATGYWRVPSALKPLWRALRKNNPGNIGDPFLQGESMPQIGDPDPALPGRSIIARQRKGQPDVTPAPYVSADHIDPLAELINIPGFLELNADNMYMVSRAPLNFQWLSQTANLMKSSRSVGYMMGVDPAWQEGQAALQNSVRVQLEQIIQRLIQTQK